MKESTRRLFFMPLLLQETMTLVILVPIVVCLFRYVSESVMKHFDVIAAGASAAATFGLILGTATKYMFVRPAIAILEKETEATPQAIFAATKKLSVLPLLEGIVIFLRFGFFGNLIATIPPLAMGIISFNEFVFGVVSVILIGLLAVPIIYLSSENSLTHFYKHMRMTGVLDKKNEFFRISLSKKTLLTILLISLPPLGLILDLLYLSMVTKVSVASLQLGFYVVVIQTGVIAVICGVLLMKSLSLSVESMSLMFEDMAKGKGDLTKRLKITGLHEIGELAFWFNAFMDDLERIIGHVRDTSLQLHKAIEEVNAGSQNLNRATLDQASSVQEISASIEELNASVKNNADLIKEGHESSNAIVKLIDHSKTMFADLASAIQRISENSKRIGDIVVTVNEVAFHTNLLALNASVEAARAGEHGKGFAVVAGEVRSLAQRSAEAAGEIKNLIEGTVSSIRAGDEMMRKTSTSLEELVNRMEFFFRMMDVINTSSIEQAQNIGELNRSISLIDTSTQHNTSTVKELSRTLENLRSIASAVAEDVQKFKIRTKRSALTGNEDFEVIGETT